MGMRNTLDRKQVNATPPIDKVLGTAYETVKSLAEKLPIISYLEANIDGFVSDIHNALDTTVAAEAAAEVSADAARDSQAAAQASQGAAHASELAAASSATAADASKTASAASAVASLASENAAKTSETNSKTSETNSKSSETNAAASKTAAATSATNSANSATASSASASAAATSQTAAAASQTASHTSETNASASAAAALASQNAAKTSETNSKTSETNSKTSETNSASSAVAAAASKTAAGTSETNASASAAAALVSQNAAKTSETNSKTSETNSAASATSASNSKTAAATSETNAAASKTAAATSAAAAAASQAAALVSEQNAKASETNAAASAAQLDLIAIGNGGTGARTAAAARTALGLGSSSTINTGTSGAAIPLLNAANTWALTQTFSSNPIIGGTAATYRGVFFQSAGKNRWAQGANQTAESGGNAGSDFSVDRYDDTGAWIDTPLTIMRSTGVVNLLKRPTMAGNTPWDSGNLNFAAPPAIGGTTPNSARFTSITTTGSVAATGGNFQSGAGPGSLTTYVTPGAVYATKTGNTTGTDQYTQMWNDGSTGGIWVNMGSAAVSKGLITATAGQVTSGVPSILGRNAPVLLAQWTGNTATPNSPNCAINCSAAWQSTGHLRIWLGTAFAFANCAVIISGIAGSNGTNWCVPAILNNAGDGTWVDIGMLTTGNGGGAAIDGVVSLTILKIA